MNEKKEMENFQENQDNVDFSWELNKENIIPLPQGRNVHTLKEILGTTQNSQREKEKEAFEQALESYEGDDPLSLWQRYIRWIEANYPSDTQRSFLAMESGIRKLKNIEKYYNDLRYVRMWIAYADKAVDPDAIFKFMYKHHIGNQVALFYIAWAIVSEKVENFAKADKIFAQGIKMNAKPLDILLQRHQQFQRRMSRMWLHQGDHADGKDYTKKKSNPTKTTNLMNQRTTLGVLSKASAKSSYRVPSREIPSSGIPGMEARNQEARNHVQNTRATIYQDKEEDLLDPNDPFVHIPHDNKKSLVHFETQEQARKENIGKSEKWSIAAAPQRTAGVQTSQHPVALPSFQIYRDEEEPQTEQMPLKCTENLNPRRTLRQRMDGATTDEEALSINPLRNIKKNVKPPLGPPVVTQVVHEAEDNISFEEKRAAWMASKMIRTPLNLPNTPILDAPSTVTRCLMFNSCSSKKQEEVQQDENELVQDNRQLDSTKGITKQLDFDCPTPVSCKGQSNSNDWSNVQTNLDVPDNDELTINTKVALVDVSGMFCSPKNVVMHSIFNDSNKKKKSYKMETAKEEKKVALSDQEDLTINTKFALQDVNSLFCSLSDGEKASDSDEEVGGPPRVHEPFEIYVDEEEEVQPKSVQRKGRKPLTVVEVKNPPKVTNKDVLEMISQRKQPDSKSSILLGGNRGRNNRSEENDYSAIHSGSQALKESNPSGNIILDPYQEDHRYMTILSGNVIKFLKSECDIFFLLNEQLPFRPPKTANTITARYLELRQWGLDYDGQHYCINGFLGAGSFGIVLSARSTTTGCSIAIKVESEVKYLPWEAFIFKQIEKRKQFLKTDVLKTDILKTDIFGCNIEPVITFHGLCIFKNGAMLVLEKGVNGTLQDVINLYLHSGKAGLPETLVMYYAVRMMTILEQFHEMNLLHGDVKPDNWLMVEENMEDSSFKMGGLRLIDFGRVIDLEMYPKNSLFVGNSQAEGFECIEMRKGTPWKHQMDSFGLCATIHCLLFGKYMEVVEVPCKCTKKRKLCCLHTTKWNIKEKLKRYWAVDLWNEVFQVLLNSNEDTIQNELVYLRKKIEFFLRADKSRYKSISRLLRQQDQLLKNK